MGISEKDYQELWNSTLQIIKDSNTYDDAIFNTYIKPTRLFRINDDVALISVPNKISSSIFSGSLDIWRSAFAQTAGGDYTLQVILNKDVEKMVPQQVMRQRTDTLLKIISISCTHSEQISSSAKTTGSLCGHRSPAAIIPDNSTTA